MKVNVFTANPEKIEGSLNMLQEGLANNSLAQGKIAFTWKKLGISPENKFTAYECEFAYEHENRISNTIVFNQFQSKLKEIDPTTSAKKVK